MHEQEPVSRVPSNQTPPAADASVIATASRYAQGSETLTFAWAQHESERQQIFDLREEVYQDGMDFLLTPGLSSHPAADPFDAISYLIYARTTDRLVSSGRFSPSMNGTWDIPELAPFMAALPGQGRSCLLAGRGVVCPGHRSIGVLSLTLYVGCAWLARHTAYTLCMGVCTPPRLRLYQQLGFLAWPDGEICIRSRQSRVYAVIHGELERIAESSYRNALTHGWHLAPESKHRDALNQGKEETA